MNDVFKATVLEVTADSSDIKKCTKRALMLLHKRKVFKGFSEVVDAVIREVRKEMIPEETAEEMLRRNEAQQQLASLEFYRREYNATKLTLQKIQDALNTVETGPALVAVARDAFRRSQATARASGKAHSGAITIHHQPDTDAYVELQRGGEEIGTVLTKDAEEIVCTLGLFSDLLDALHTIANTSLTRDDCRDFALAAITKANERMSALQSQESPEGPAVS